MIRAVLDPGTVVSAVVTPTGTCANIVRAWRAGAFEIVVSPLLLAELRTVLGRVKLRRYIEPAEVEVLVDEFRANASLREDAPMRRHVSRDPKDDYLLALALGHADVLVSGDRDLTEARVPVRVVTPRAFLDALQA